MYFLTITYFTEWIFNKMALNLIKLCWYYAYNLIS